MIKRLAKWWSWFVANFLTVDLTTYHPIVEKPRNRRERRREEWNKSHPWSYIWKYVPWYKNREFVGTANWFLKDYGIRAGVG